jgi:hypothetical protein
VAAPAEDGGLIGAIIMGSVLSVVGMALRWAAHIVQNRKVEEDD